MVSRTGMINTLYVSYDGMTDPLGIGQVLSYLQGIARNGYKVTLISFEKELRFRQLGDSIRNLCNDAGIEWIPLTYTKRPPVLSTVYDVWRLVRLVGALHRKRSFALIHCRSYIAAFAGLALRRRYGIPFIFDMRGFWIDEKIEAGEWNQKKMIYRWVSAFLRKKEAAFYKHSSIIITLTHASAKVIADRMPLYASKTRVIPTCVNLDVFRPFEASLRSEARMHLGIPSDAFVLLYSGGFGGSYDINFLLRVYDRLRNDNPAACLLILSKDGITGIEGRKDIPNVYTLSLPYHEVSKYLMAGDIGIVNYVTSFSVSARSPTKVGEYWASGLPAIAPKGVGDVDQLFLTYPGSGVSGDGEDLPSLVRSVVPADRTRLRGYAAAYFGLDKGIERYLDIYHELSPGSPR